MYLLSLVCHSHNEENLKKDRKARWQRSGSQEFQVQARLCHWLAVGLCINHLGFLDFNSGKQSMTGRPHRVVWSCSNGSSGNSDKPTMTRTRPKSEGKTSGWDKSPDEPRCTVTGRQACDQHKAGCREILSKASTVTYLNYPCP